MKFTPTKLEDVIIIEPDVFDDSRGFFMETFHIDTFAEAGLPTEFFQDSHSHSKMGVLRGLHYQAPKEQGKLVRTASGAIYDGVPQKVVPPWSRAVTAAFASPKSERRTWPRPSSNTFSGLRSR